MSLRKSYVLATFIYVHSYLSQHILKAPIPQQRLSKFMMPNPGIDDLVFPHNNYTRATNKLIVTDA